MKKVLAVTPQDKLTGSAILLLRIGLGLMMFVHGLPKLLSLFSGDPIQFANVWGMGPELTLGLAVFAEVVCSILILVGLGTRFATVPLIITMIVAVFVIHANDPFAKYEMGLHYLLGYLVLLITGGGRYSIDAVLTDSGSWNRHVPVAVKA